MSVTTNTEATKAEDNTEAEATGTALAEVSAPLTGRTLTEEETAKAKAEEERAAIIAKRTEALAALAKAETEEAKAEALAIAASFGDLYVGDRITEVRETILPALLADWRYTAGVAFDLSSAGFQPYAIAMALDSTLTEEEAKHNTVRTRATRLAMGGKYHRLAGLPTDDTRTEDMRAAGNRSPEALDVLYVAALAESKSASLKNVRTKYDRAVKAAIAEAAKAEALAAIRAEAEATKAEEEATKADTETEAESGAEEATKATESGAEAEANTEASETESGAESGAESGSQGPRSAGGVSNTEAEAEERVTRPTLAPNGPGAEAGVTLTEDTVSTWPEAKFVSAFVIIATEASRRKSLTDASRTEMRRVLAILGKANTVAPRVLTPTEVAEAKAKAEAESKAKAEATAKATKATRATRAAK